ncbi:MAG: T9SS type B sorting domain-containing protein [Bacteroidetes bacterium]|nr:T9SS type B sorting domain-containing protein [Bacteroidota bacterium]
MSSSKYLILHGILLLSLFLSVQAKAQYMDDFSSPAVIQIPGSGFATGTFSGDSYPMALATVSSNEYFPDDLVHAGLIERSIWYKFTIPTRRAVKITLDQNDTNTSQLDMGMAVYKDPQGLAAPNYLADAFPVLNRVGFVQNSCLEEGTYYVQVLSRLRCTDSINVSINIELPNPNAPDFYHLMVDSFTTPFNTLYTNLMSACSNYPDREVKALAPASIGWNQVSERIYLDGDYDQYLLELSSFIKNYQFAKILLLREDSTLPISQWPVIVDEKVNGDQLSRNGYLITLGCPKMQALKKGLYRLLIFYPENSYSSNIHITWISQDAGGTPHADPFHLPSQFQNLTLKSVFYDTLNCNSLIDTLLCPNLNQQLEFQNWKGITCQYNRQLWYTFNSAKSQIASFKTQLISRFSIDYPSLKTELYKGDIQNGCDKVSLVSPNGLEYCLESGVYTLRLLFGDDPSSSGFALRISPNFYDIAQYAYQFNDSMKPEVLGDIISSFPNPTVSKGDVFDNIPQIVWLGDHWDTASFEFREFYISSVVPLLFTVDRRVPPYYDSWVDGYLFKGRKSQGTGNELIDIIDTYLPYYCGFPDTGWYTMVTRKSIYEADCMAKGQTPYQVSISPAAAQGNNSTIGSISNPFVYNNGMTLNAGDTNYQGTLYPIEKLYQSNTPIYFSCKNRTPKLTNYLETNCNWKFNGAESYLYSEFEINQAMELQYLARQTGNFLIKGSISQNPNLLYDSANWITPCETRVVQYCNLQPGKYSIVSLGYIGDSTLMEMRMIPIKQYPEEHFESYVDLGVIQGATEIPPVLLNCSISADSTSLELHYMSGIIPVLTPNKKVWSGNGSTWYYFELKQAGTLEFTTKMNASIYRLPDSLDAAALKSNSSLRKFYVSSLDRINTNSVNDSTTILYKGTCNPGKYFVEFQGYYLWGFTTCKMNWSPLPIAGINGDHCQNAGLTPINKAGNTTAQLDSRCMSIGEGFGEDGNNMACLPLPNNTPYVSLWHKVHINPGMRYNVSFHLQGVPGVNLNNRVKYRILYGSCDALTPGPCVENLNASFGFECMEAADFFLQIIVPEDWGKDILQSKQVELVVDVKASSNPVCKPFDPFRPLASFNFDGQCNADSVHFRNYSSQGKDIHYFWDFGDGTTSNLKDPVHWYFSQSATRDFPVKLITENVALEKKDSITRTVRIRKEKMRIDLPFSDTLVQCGTRLDIQASSNYSDAVFFHFGSYWQDTSFGAHADTNFIYPKNTVRFIAYANNCSMDTTLLVRTHNRLLRLVSDSFLCKDQVFHFDLKPHQDVTWYPGAIQSPLLDWNQAGELRVEVRELGCILRDTMEIEDLTPVFMHSSDTVFCQQDSGLLRVLPIYSGTLHWENGSTALNRWVNLDGQYWVEGKNKQCLNRDTMQVEFRDFRNAIIPTDFFICADSIIQLKSKWNAAYYSWSTGDTSQNIQVSDTGWIYLELGKKACSSRDTARINFYPKDLNLGKDTGFCEALLITLDAGIGSNYHWYPLAGQNRYFTVNDSGTYWVEKINRYNCPVSDTIQIVENCGPWLLMPTAFSPNGDGLNDVLKWNHVDVTEFEIHIYDRWGTLVYSSQDIQSYWDGTFQGELLPDGVYVYQVNFGGADYLGKYHRKNTKGLITLLR